MKLSELLLERMSAAVWTNADQKLKVISNLVKKEFGLVNPHGESMCLMSQTIYTMASVSDLDPDEIVSGIDTEPPTKAGHTVASLNQFFNKTPVQSGDKWYQFTLSYEDYETADQAIAAVQSGQPVIIVFRGDTSLYYFSGGFGTSRGGLVTLNAYLNHVNSHKDAEEAPSGTWYHTQLLIGYDEGEHELDGEKIGPVVIARDMRDKYAFKGYMKIDRRILDETKAIKKMFSIVVDDVKEIKGPKKKKAVWKTGKPKHEGTYKIRRSGSDGSSQIYSYWNGSKWSSYTGDPARARNFDQGPSITLNDPGYEFAWQVYKKKKA